MQTEETNIIETPQNNLSPHDAAKYYNRTGGAICIHYAILYVVQIIAIIFICIAVAMAGSKKYTQIITDPSVMLYLTAASYVIANIAGTIIALAFNGKLKNSLKGMFMRSGFTPAFMALCVPAAMCIQAISIILQNLFVLITGSSGMENMQMPELMPGNTLNNVVYVLYVGILGPVTEELLFRGAVMKGFNFAGQKFAVIFSALWFALFHGNIMQGIIAFLLGIFFGYLNIKAGSIMPSVILHITNNMTAILLEAVSSSMSDKTLDIFYTVYIIAAIILGGICLFRALSKLKNNPSKENSFFEPECCPDKDSKKKYGLRAAVKSPFLWIAFAIYMLLIISNIIISNINIEI